MAARKRTTSARVEAPRNRLLRALPAVELKRLLPRLERVSLEVREVVLDNDVPIEHVYFVESGVVSIVGILSDGTSVETATVGNEGLVGLPVFHGVDRTAAQAFCQVPGEALRMRATHFTTEIRRSGGNLVRMLGRYTEALFIQVAQSAACNRVHVVRERCARWILQTHDRVDGDSFPLPQRFLGQMLGVQRTTVTEAAGHLEERGLIEYRAGTVRVVDREGLEAAACECYAIIRREFDRLIDGRQAPSPIDHVRTSTRGRSTLKPPNTNGAHIDDPSR